jgi:hypothetical protein
MTSRRGSQPVRERRRVILNSAEPLPVLGARPQAAPNARSDTRLRHPRGIPGNPERDDRGRSQQSLPSSAFSPRPRHERTADRRVYGTPGIRQLAHTEQAVLGICTGVARGAALQTARESALTCTADASSAGFGTYSAQKPAAEACAVHRRPLRPGARHLRDRLGVSTSRTQSGSAHLSE